MVVVRQLINVEARKGQVTHTHLSIAITIPIKQEVSLKPYKKPLTESAKFERYLPPSNSFRKLSQDAAEELHTSGTFGHSTEVQQNQFTGSGEYSGDDV